MRNPFALATSQPKLTPEQTEWFNNTVKSLNTYSEKRLFVRTPDLDKVIQALVNLAPIAGYELLAIQQLILSQLFYAAVVTDKETTEIAVQAQQEWGLSQEQIQTALNKAYGQVKTAPEFVTKAPASVQESGEVMADVWKGFGLPAQFEEGLESGLRHLSLKFRIPRNKTFAQYEGKLSEALSHGGYHPGIPTVFSPLTHGIFEVHIPKPPSQWQSLSFLEYLGAAIGYQPTEGDTIATLLDAICAYYHPRAHLLSAPAIPVSIDLRGQPVELHFGMNGLIVGATGMGKSTSIKAIIMLLMLMFPPHLLRFTAIDLKNLTLPKFSDGWRNPWMLSQVITMEDARFLRSFFKELKNEKDNRAKKLKKAGVENWLTYNARFPDDPIPFSPLLFDEVSLLKDAIGEVEAAAQIDEIVGVWRFCGMPGIFGTRYPANQNGMGPEVRSSLKTKLVFQASEACAKMAFDHPDHIKAVKSLLGGGDCIAQAPGMLVPAHGQGLDAHEDLVDAVLDYLKAKFAPADDWFNLTADPAPDVTGDAWGCPKCKSLVTTKNGKTSNGKQKYKCGDCGNDFVS